MPSLSTIGRLDKDTSGLLLITDDGDFLHRVISPRHHVAKRYVVTLDRPLEGTEVETFASGALMLDSETTPLAPATLEIVGERLARLTITEGRYHQVRRMFAAVGNHVTALHRDRIGALGLPDDLGHVAALVARHQHPLGVAVECEAVQTGTRQRHRLAALHIHPTPRPLRRFPIPQHPARRRTVP